MANKNRIRVKGFHKDGDEHHVEEDESPLNKSFAMESAKLFFEQHFCVANDFNDSTLQCNSLDLLNKISRQYGDLLLIEDVFIIMRELGYKQANLPGSGIRPVWLLKEKK